MNQKSKIPITFNLNSKIFIFVKILMGQNYEQQSHPHFPEDRDAPTINQKNSFLDYLLFGLIAFLTLTTVSLSIYIIVVKYF
ncbi:MAG: hypothetical protein M3R36_06765 [Bacteroidota bacterium]|nr:hypothetical protein [Bacteroidota bacterium]